ncbi:MAG: hypothetical protein H7146_10695 [Burkholderiaceae bacterium]|nr:hypothetical protein [Microbacteriaceae bacterium]
MTDHIATSPPSPTRRRRGVRTRAILAGGLVLGLGATVTLAAWNDSEFAQGTFTAGSFSLVGSTDGTDFTDHPFAGSPAALDFTVDASTLQPGDVLSAPFSMRLTANTVESGTVQVLSATGDGVVTGLTYALVEHTEFGCLSPVAGTLVPAPTAMAAPISGVTFDLDPGDGFLAGDAVHLCFTVTADADLVQGQSGTAKWEFNAQSQAL